MEDHTEISQERYNEMLCVLPPIWGEAHTKYLQNLCASYPRKLKAVQCFQVGEATDSRNGRPRFDTYAEVQNEKGNAQYLFLGTLSRLDHKTCGNQWNY